MFLQSSRFTISTPVHASTVHSTFHLLYFRVFPIGDVPQGNGSDASGTSALESAERALQASLQALAERLNLSVASGGIFDPGFIGDQAEAIQKVAMALSTVRLARQTESPTA